MRGAKCVYIYVYVYYVVGSGPADLPLGSLMGGPHAISHVDFKKLQCRISLDLSLIFPK